MTGEQLYNGWWRAASDLSVQLVRWDALPQLTVDAWIFVAHIIDENKPPCNANPLDFMLLFGVGCSPTALAIASRLLANWFYYFPTFEGSSTSTHAKGDVWIFRAGKSKATVIDVDGTKLKLRLNGIETDWIEEAELMKDAVKQSC